MNTSIKKILDKEKKYKNNFAKYIFIALSLILISLSLFISVSASEICNNGIDDDGDGLIDGLTQLDFNNGLGLSSYYRPDTLLEKQLDNLFNRQSYWGGDYWRYITQFRNDAATSQKLCRLLGYKDVISTTQHSWTSPGDNYVTYWNGNQFSTTHASGNNYWIESISCKNKLSACNNEKDDDGDGKIDLADPGCANRDDDSEIQHDPDCLVCTVSSDCGTNGFTGNAFCQSNNVFQNYITYTCNNPGTSSSSCTSSTNVQLKTTCTANQLCNNGLCTNINCFNDGDCNDNNIHTLDKCTNPGTSSSSCTHISILCLNNLDCGTNGFTGNAFCQSNNVFQNYITYTCNNPGQENSYCTNSASNQLKQDCGTGSCSDYGANYCKNNNLYKSRTCTNKGCSNGFCFNTNSTQEVVVEICSNGCSNSQCNPGIIICHNNSECGTNGFTGNAFCQSNNVFQNYITYTCNNPGTAQSTCSSSSNTQLKQTCTYGCTNGTCIASTCVDNDQDTYDSCNPGQPGDDGKPIDCNDNNANVHPNAIEICNGIDDDCDGLIDENNGNCASGQICTNGQCSNIACSNDAQCGTNGFTGNALCHSNNVFQNYITYTCVNPGQANSHCTNSSCHQLKQDCGTSSCSDYGANYCKNNNLYKSRTCTNRGCSNALCFNTNFTDEAIVQQCSNGCSNGQCNPGIIICHNNSECGTNGFTGNASCLLNNVFQNFIIYTCVNPGEENSYCTNSTSNQLKQECSYKCENGKCKDKTSSYVPCSAGECFQDRPPIEQKQDISYTFINDTIQKIQKKEVKCQYYFCNLTWLWILICLLFLLLIILIISFILWILSERKKKHKRAIIK